MKSAVLVILNIFLLNFYSPFQSAAQPLCNGDDTICHIQIVTDSLFNSPQRINILLLDKEHLPRYSIELAYQTSELIKTSQIAESRNAFAAINGSFFDMDRGGSVSYFEKDDSVISRTRASELKWATPDSLINGALVLYKNHTLEIDTAGLQQLYEVSKMENFVMVSLKNLSSLSPLMAGQNRRRE